MVVVLELNCNTNTITQSQSLGKNYYFSLNVTTRYGVRRRRSLAATSLCTLQLLLLRYPYLPRPSQTVYAGNLELRITRAFADCCKNLVSVLLVQSLCALSHRPEKPG